MKRSQLKLWTIFYNKNFAKCMVISENLNDVTVLTDKGGTYEISNGRLGNHQEDFIKHYELLDMSPEEFFKKVRVHKYNNELVKQLKNDYQNYKLRGSFDEQSEEILLIIK